MTMRTLHAVAAVGLMAVALGSCATLAQVVQPPRFTQADGYDTQVRLLGPAAGRPLGGAQVRIFARVQNPNAFGLTLAALRGNLFLEDAQAAQVDFPLGLPLAANGDQVIPLDINISFSDLPGLVGAAERIFTRNMVAYRLDGTLTVDAAPFGQPTFGPTTWLQGESRVIR